MYIKNLTLNNFKNFSHLELDFTKINCIVGNNGVGKTNILDAIYYLSFCKSFLGTNDSDTIRYNTDFFSIKGDYMLNDYNEETFLISLKSGERKQIKHGSQPYKKFSEHIGKIPCVVVSPTDQSYITGRSEKKRKFMDIILSQTDVVYMDNLINYNKCLEQRNKLLKIMQQNGYFDAIQLNVFNERLTSSAELIREKRQKFFNDFLPDFKYYYKYISDDKEDVNIEYDTFEGSLIDLLQQNLAKEKILCYTTNGIHRDDLIFYLKGHNINHSGSQGQQKTFVLALKMAQFAYLKKKKQVTPLLLLDDIFDKFDFQRVEKILNLVANNYFNQVFLTDTHPDRVERLIPKNKINESSIIRL